MTATVKLSPRERTALLGRLTGDRIVCSAFVTEARTEAQVSAEVRLPPGADAALAERLKLAVADAVGSIASELARE